MKRLLTVLLPLLLAVPAAAHDTHADATYMANEAVLIAQGETRIMFDPFYKTGFGTYQEVPDDMMAKLMAQQVPFDGIDGIFVSHVHGDHFDGQKLFDYMNVNTDVLVFLPGQGAKVIRELAAEDKGLVDRLVPFELTEGGPVKKIERNGIMIEAVRIPHSGWPRPDRKDINNILFRVTLEEGGATVMHMGDADINDAHFAPYEDHWRARSTHHAFPPYWFFGNTEGRTILKDRLQVGAATGVHVPIRVPRGLEAFDYFSKPGESRIIYLPETED